MIHLSPQMHRRGGPLCLHAYEVSSIHLTTLSGKTSIKDVFFHNEKPISPKYIMKEGKTMKQKIGKISEAAWVAAVIICGLGVCLSAKSGFGVSMVVAPAYVIYLKVSQALPWFTFGMSEYCLQGLFVILLSIILRRFKWKYPLAFFTALCYGLALDAWRAVFGTEVYTEMYQRCLACAGGAVITAFAIALFLRTYLPQEVYELVVKEITEKYKFNMNKVKLIYDWSSLGAAIILMLVLFRRFSFEMIGIGTLIMTVINTPIIALFGRLLDSRFEFTSAFESFQEKFNELMN